MNEIKKEEIQETINNPMIKKMQPWKEELSSTIWQQSKKNLAPNQVSETLDMRENKIAKKRSPKN